MIYSKDCKVHPPPDIKNVRKDDISTVPILFLQRLEELDEIDRWGKMAQIDAIFFYLFPLVRLTTATHPFPRALPSST